MRPIGGSGHGFVSRQMHNGCSCTMIHEILRTVHQICELQACFSLYHTQVRRQPPMLEGIHPPRGWESAKYVVCSMFQTWRQGGKILSGGPHAPWLWVWLYTKFARSTDITPIVLVIYVVLCLFQIYINVVTVFMLHKNYQARYKIADQLYFC